jgi:hypothetical protein
MQLRPGFPLVAIMYPPPWGVEHNIALFNPRRGAEQAIVHLVRGVLCYCNMHSSEYESPVGEDYVLGPAIADILVAIRTLLNGEIGRLDAGTIDKWCLEMARYHSLDEHEESLRD